jgi:hypothetical protein
MKIISHRGNLTGSKPEFENNPTYIDVAIMAGFDVEVDVWYVDGQFFLGHDAPTYLVESTWIGDRTKRLWFHAKNHDALVALNFRFHSTRVFWHETDRMTFVSDGTLWMYPGNYSPYGITVELGSARDMPRVAGVCTDHPVSWSMSLRKG